ncbi:MAG: shikimate dehydrogenase, partial [Chloroflexota bacterium]
DPLSLGALVTTHKINVLKAATDLFDDLTPDADLCGEVSSIYKREGKLIGHAVDPVNSGQSMAHFLGIDYFQKFETEVMCLGAGGSAIAMVTHWCTQTKAEHRPKRAIIVNRSKAKLDNLTSLLERLPDTDIDFDLIQNSDPTVNDQIMAGLSPHAVVINATGMGKDIPGSPITDQGLFPEEGVAWELNYRGKLDFLHQAKTQQSSRKLIVEDGWYYFLIGWTSVVENVFDLTASETEFQQLAKAAETIRG